MPALKIDGTTGASGDIAATSYVRAAPEYKQIGTVCHDLTKDGLCGPIVFFESLRQFPEGTKIYAAIEYEESKGEG